MNDVFRKLNHEKKERILNAAYKEFADKDYKNASTNQIVKNAKISKGILFTYFNSKHELYCDLIYLAIEMVDKDYLSMIDENQPDFLKRLKDAALLKYNSLSVYPERIKFITNIILMKDEENDLPDDLTQKIQNMCERGYQKIYANIDTTYFRDDIPSNDLKKLITFMMDGYEAHLTSAFKGKKLSEDSIDLYWEEFYHYLDYMRLLFYKNEMQ